MDFISSPITATFIAGTTIATIDVPVIIDNIVESLEVFGLNIIIPPSLEDQVILGGIAETIAYITDNTSKQIWCLTTFDITLMNPLVQLE